MRDSAEDDIFVMLELEASQFEKENERECGYSLID